MAFDPGRQKRKGVRKERKRIMVEQMQRDERRRGRNRDEAQRLKFLNTGNDV